MSGPRATRAAPVRVARLIDEVGTLPLQASASASASTRRPSASVLFTSTVRPLRLRQDVAGAHRGAGDRVLDRGDEDAQAQIEAERHDHSARGRARSRRRPCPFSSAPIDAGGLMFEPSGIKAHALADQRDLRRVRAAPDSCRAGAAPVPRPRRRHGSAAGSARLSAAPRMAVARRAVPVSASAHEGGLQRFGAEIVRRAC